MTFNSLKNKYIKALLDSKSVMIKSINETPFIKRNGQKSYMFFDHAKLSSSADGYRAFVDVIQSLVLKEFKSKNFLLCNVDSKISAQMVGSVAYNLSRPQIVYKSKELTAAEKGTNTQLTGNRALNVPVAILDDVATGGDGTAKKVADLVSSEFIKVKEIQIFVGFIRAVKTSTYKTNHVLTLDELVDIIWDKLTEDQKKAVQKEKTLI